MAELARWQGARQQLKWREFGLLQAPAIVCSMPTTGLAKVLGGKVYLHNSSGSAASTGSKVCAAPCGREAAEEVLESSVAALGFAIVCSVSSKMSIDKFHLQRVGWQCSTSVWLGQLSAKKRQKGG